jgi:hypothetical protein
MYTKFTAPGAISITTRHGNPKFPALGMLSTRRDMESPGTPQFGDFVEEGLGDPMSRSYPSGSISTTHKRVRHRCTFSFYQYLSTRSAPTSTLGQFINLSSSIILSTCRVMWSCCTGPRPARHNSTPELRTYPPDFPFRGAQTLPVGAVHSEGAWPACSAACLPGW